MKPAFWDSSALVPLCARQQASPVTYRLLSENSVVVWWATAVEIRSALDRLLRTGELTAAEHEGAGRRLSRLRERWREVAPTDDVRAEAERLLQEFALRAADSLQLAAAMIWAVGRPAGRAFICGDAELLEAARKTGFDAIEA